jgi:hypothetical protein
MGSVPQADVVAKAMQLDEVIPVHGFDDTMLNRMTLVCALTRFEDVLDAEKIHDALKKLVDMGEWRKLRGRIRLTVSLQSPCAPFRRVP